MPNLVAYAALLVWPLVAAWLFTVMPKERAVVWAVVGSYLFLPEGTAFDFPVVPPLNKVSLPNLVLLALVAVRPGPPLRLLPRSRVATLLLGMLIAGAFLTAMTNGDPLFFGPTVLPGLSPYDALSSVIQTLLVVAPFFVGRSVLGSVEGHRLILRTLLAAGLFYAVLMLVEIRLSPQLHNWVYGFFPHSFDQQMREGGFRPVVFMVHGLYVAFFAMTVTVCAAVLGKSAGPQRGGPLFAASAGMFVVLVLCKSLGSLVFAIVLLPVALLAGLRTQLRIAAAIAVVAMLYPALRGAGVVPLDTILEAARSVSTDRADSLNTRIVNEESLLDRAAERPLLGWGSWGRNQIYDPVTGDDLSITDGYWIIVIGTSGWIGYIATFGLFGWPILSVWRTSRDPPARETAGLCLLLAINMVELLPNSTLQPWAWLIAGALLGHAEQGDRRAAADDAAQAPPAGPEPIRTVL